MTESNPKRILQRECSHNEEDLDYEHGSVLYPIEKLVWVQYISNDVSTTADSLGL